MEDKPPLFTIGYGSLKIDQFVRRLRQHRIDFLIDVRSKPYSRYKPAFKKEALAARLQAEGIRYVFMGDTLGGLPEDRSCYTDGKVDYIKCREKPFHKRGIKRLRDAWDQGLRVALMCACSKPEKCHRTKLVGVSLNLDGIPVAHIEKDGRTTDQDSVMARIPSPQEDLFGSRSSQATTSRKRYIHE
jgi:uncharacterized protein (DUF488 family)